MTSDQFVELIKSLGVPIAFSAVLLWFFLGFFKRLSEQHSKMLEELTALRNANQSMKHAVEVNERLMGQNERLVAAIQSKEDAFIKLLQAIDGREEVKNGRV